MAPKIVDKETKKGEILQAAMSQFAQKGVLNTKMADIARAAQIGKGTIYEYFRSKEEIVRTVFESFHSSADQLVKQLEPSGLKPDEKLRKLIENSMHQFLHEGADFAEILMDFWAEGVRTKNREITGLFDLEKLYSQYRTAISGILLEGVEQGCFKEINTFAIASAIIGAMDGIMLQWILNRNLINISDVTNSFIKTIFEGIKK